MTQIRTLELPDFDDYTVEDVVVENNVHIARERYYKDKNLVVEIDIYFTLDDKDQPLRWPYKVVVKDINGTVRYTDTTE